MSRISSHEIVSGLHLKAVLLLVVAFGATLCYSAEEPGKKDEKTAKPARIFKEPEHNYGPSLDGKGHTSMFGVEASGYRFVYVIDRSGSMGGTGTRP